MLRSGQAEGAFGGFGDLSMSFGWTASGGDAGRGGGGAVALDWQPERRLRLSASRSRSLSVVSDQQRFEPTYFGTPVRVYDFITGEAVEVSPVLGGNPDLRSPELDQQTFSLSAGPFTRWRLQGGMTYQKTRGAAEIGAFPGPMPELEAAFPQRFMRGPDGRLVSVDQRQFSIDTSVVEVLTTNFSLRAPLGGGGSRAVSQKALRLSLNHSLQLRNKTSLHASLPHMDRLAGDGGGQPRQQFSLLVDLAGGAWDANAAVRRGSVYRLRRVSGMDGADDLVVSALVVADLRFRLQLARTASTGGGGGRRGSGLELELEISNLFDARPSARLADGRRVAGYGRDEQDPVGRTLRIGMRQRF